MEVPKNYSADMVAEIAVKAENEYQHGAEATGIQPNIIMIMNEAWGDLRVLGDIEVSEPFMPFVDGLDANAVKGNLAVSILGGLTANTEFEALTGNSLALLPPAVVPYQNQVNHDMYSLARVLKDRGYYTMAMHPSGAGAWNRDKAYDYFGFDEFVSVEDFQTPYLYVRDFLSDECNFNEIIYRYENRNKEQPFFLFDVTIQNHSGYFGDIELPIEVKKINGISAEEVGYTYDVQTYLNLMKISDEAFRQLVSYFEQIEEPTIICMFGDHQPILYDDFYNAVFAGRELSAEEQNMLKYQTPYVIWANYDVEFKEYGDISANYLPAVLMEASGLELPVYYKFLINQSREYPILSVPGCKNSNGEMSLAGELPLQDYKILQYNQLYDMETEASLFE